jgi:hypothetical protein
MTARLSSLDAKMDRYDSGFSLLVSNSRGRTASLWRAGSKEFAPLAISAIFALYLRTALSSIIKQDLSRHRFPPDKRF